MHHYICPSPCDMSHVPWHTSHAPWYMSYDPWYPSQTPWYTYSENPYFQSGPIFALPLAGVRRHILQ